MVENQMGVTALVTAFSRAYHSTTDEPKIFDDFLAIQLFNKMEEDFFRKSIGSLYSFCNPEPAASELDTDSALAWVMQNLNGSITLCRSRFSEERLLDSIRQGIGQYVILGAGMDTFAFRRPDWAASLQIFELDHPVTQAMKRQRIEAAGWKIPEELHFVPIDFSHQDISTVLLQSGFDPHQPAFISWLGVTFYLTREVVLSTLCSLAATIPAGSQVVFDYLNNEAFTPGKMDQRLQSMQSIVQQAGEPMKIGFDPCQLEMELAQADFQVKENLTPDDLELRYFQQRNDNYHAFPHIHLMLAEKK